MIRSSNSTCRNLNVVLNVCTVFFGRESFEFLFVQKDDHGQTVRRVINPHQNGWEHDKGGGHESVFSEKFENLAWRVTLQARNQTAPRQGRVFRGY